MHRGERDVEDTTVGCDSGGRQLRFRRRLFLVLALVGALFAVAPVAAQATSLGTSFPANGAVFKGAPYDVYGTNGNNLLEDGATRVAIERELPNGTLDSASPSSALYKQATFGGAIAEALEGGYWAWSHKEETEGILYTYYTHYAIPTADGQWRVITSQETGLDDGNPHTVYGPPVTYTIDTIAPETTIVSGPNPVGSSSAAHFVFSGTDANPPKGLASGIDYFDCRLDSTEVNAWDHCTEPGGSAPYEYDLSGVSEGGHTLEVRALDKASNEDKTPASYFWGVDKTPPEITIGKPVDKDHYVLHESVTPQFSCKDPLKGVAPATPYASGVASCTATPIDTSTLGPHTFTVTAVDKAGNESTRTIAYVVDPPRYGDLVLEDHPLAYYRLDEPLGSGRMLDSSGNGHDGEYKNGVVLGRPAAISCERRPHPPHACELTNDPEDSSAYFPARDGYGYANGITAPTQEYSIEAWVKPTDGQDMMIAAHGGGGQLFISGGHLAFRQTQDTIVAPGAAGAVPPGRWSYVAATWDGHTSRLYVDGQEVTSANWANKEPSGSATFYVGYGDQAPWFHGYEDEVAYYGSALSPGRIFDRWQIGTAHDHPSPTGPGTSRTGPENTDTAIPYANIDVPVDNATYAPTKVPVSDFDCSDLDGPGDIASCEAELDGVPIKSGDPLPQAPGSYSLTLTATDIGGNVYVHTHNYVVEPYADVVGSDDPLAYYRLGDPGDTMADSSGNGHDGTYENDTESGPVGISGDGDHARLFEGEGGYGHVDGITAPTNESTLEAWVYPYDGRDEAIVGHGDAGELDIIGGHFSYRRMETTLTAQIGPGGRCLAPTPGSWTHVVGTWDGVTMRIYVDGEPCGEVESTRRPSSSSTFYVGYGELAPWFHGAIDEVGYYPTALSGERVHEHYIADPPPAELDAVEAGTASGEGGQTQGAAGTPGPSGGATGTPAATGATAPAQARCTRLVGKARKACLKRAHRRVRHGRGR